MLKKTVVLSILLSVAYIFSTGCVSLFEAINYGPVTIILNKKFDQSKITRIATFPLDDSGYHGRDRGCGQLVSDWYAAELLKTGYYEVIERYQVEKILKEQGFQQTGAVDINTAVQAGKILGVQGLLMGSAGGVENAFTVTVKLIDVETGNAAWTIVYETNHPKRAVPKLKAELDRYYASRTGK